MRLKRLELIGFKSFADRTELDTVPGVTAVVGPNGSGKSNIADAIRWVLGEQSAKSLRGAKMEDIIFAGSQTRKAVNFCEVALTIDNSDHVLPLEYAEVTVARRVYRTGESEYLINRQACRLRDVAELFMDTGVGREAYSIIGQGRIEEILSTKSEDRRGVFEEAAGIVKFKTRRKEAEKKLSEAAQNAMRVQDILAELEDQLGPLQERARVARAYKELAQEAGQLGITVLTAELDALLSRRAQLTEARQIGQRQIEQVHTDGQAAEVALAEVKEQADALDRQLQQAQAQLVEATAGLEQAEADRRVAFERQEHAITQMDDLRLMHERLQADAEAVLRERVELVDRRGSVATRVEDLSALLQDEQARQDGGALLQLKEGLADARAQLIEQMRDLATSRNELKNVEQQLDLATRRIVRQREELAELQADLERAEADLEACHSACAAAREQEAAATEDLVRAREHTAACEQRRLQAVGQLQEAERASLLQQSRLHALADLEKDLEGYAAGPKAILAAAREHKVKGVRGAVAELIGVGPDHATAIEIALGGSLQNIVVDNEADARAAIDYLKRRQMGRATFLPISTIRGRKIPLHDLQMVKSATGYLGVAMELVTHGAEYTAVVESLLGNVLVARTLADANAIARVLQHRFRVVTLEGDLVSPGGSMTGGSLSRRGAGILGRAQAIVLLEQTVAQAKTVVEGLTKTCEEADLASRLARARGAEIEARVSSLQGIMREETGRMGLLTTSAGRLRDRLQVLARELQTQETEVSLGQTSASDLRVRIAADEVAATEAQAMVAECERVLQQEEAAAMGRFDQLSGIRVQLAEQEEAMRGLDEALMRLDARDRQLQEERLRLQSDQSESALRAAQLRDHLRGCEEAGQVARSRRDEWQAAAAALREQRGLHAKALENAEALCQSWRHKVQEVADRVHQLDVAIGKVEAELEGKVEILAQEHGLGLELARDRYPLSVDLPVARSRLLELRRDMDAFGEVSLGSVEEYDRVRERYDFLKSQSDDLAVAQGQLQELIEGIDAEMCKRFVETFDLIRAQFQLVFSSLFGGGRADVFLVDPAQPLLCGIEIVAEPPGKRMQTLSLLSGGERALTALALLFAVLRVKPVPFCVLDEVEAALDEANVARFAEFLREFAQETQFIVITHRRGTMEAADVLYGVTMQESGVSKLVSVRVEEEEESDIA
ncbi:MAG: chromosome segregation protein SMC [Firmicutes bacterium]|nr:chromosome segregation protein SMC [Bacillota bacterium]